MGLCPLAFCHTLPRDNWLRWGAFLVFVSFLLIVSAIGVGSRRSLDHTSAGEFVNKHNDQAVVAIKSDRLSFVSFTGGVRTETVFCEGSVGLHQPYRSTATQHEIDKCHSYVYWTKVSAALFISTVILMFLGLCLIAFTIVPLTKTSAWMIFMFCVAVAVPTFLVCIAVGIYDGKALPTAEDLSIRLVLQQSSTPITDSLVTSIKKNDLRLRRTRAYRLLIAGIICCVLGFLLAVFRMIYQKVKRHQWKVELYKARDVEGILQTHIVNDDGKRQSAMWERHKVSVCELLGLERITTAGDTTIVVSSTSTEPTGQEPTRVVQETSFPTEPAQQDSSATSHEPTTSGPP